MTNGQGYFEAPLLQPGNYDVSVEMPGFKTATRAGVQLAVAQQVTLSFTLEVGQVTESVVVTAERAGPRHDVGDVGREFRLAAGRARCRCSRTCPSASRALRPA